MQIPVIIAAVVLALGITNLVYVTSNNPAEKARKQIFVYDGSGKIIDSPLGKPLQHVVAAWGEPLAEFDDTKNTYYYWMFKTFHRPFYLSNYYFIFGYDKQTGLCTSAPWQIHNKAELETLRRSLTRG